MRGYFSSVICACVSLGLLFLLRAWELSLLISLTRPARTTKRALVLWVWGSLLLLLLLLLLCMLFARPVSGCRWTRQASLERGSFAEECLQSLLFLLVEGRWDGVGWSGEYDWLCMVMWTWHTVVFILFSHAENFARGEGGFNWSPQCLQQYPSGDLFVLVLEDEETGNFQAPWNDCD